jgi:hypothetical protein
MKQGIPGHLAALVKVSKNKAPYIFTAGGFIAALDVSDFIISASQI